MRNDMNDNALEKHMKICHAIMGFSKKFKGFVNADLEAQGLGFAEAVTLISLMHCLETGASAESLLKSISYDKSVMSRTLKNLEEAELIRKAPNPADDRSKLIFLTDKGVVLAKASMSAMQTWSEDAFASLSSKETETLIKLLGKIN